jgi:glutamate synthase (NADPH/NADH) small chain
VELKIHGVSSKYVAELHELGLKHFDADQLVELVQNGVSAKYIAELRQARDLGKLPVGRRVLVIGGGMTAIDIAIQSKLLGAEDVTILYRRGAEHMKASPYEQDLAQTKGVKIKHWLQPKRVLTNGGKAMGLACDYVHEIDGKLESTGESIEIGADMIFKAIGQTAIDVAGGALALSGGRIVIDAEKRTSVKGIWAGGDCAAGGQDLTVAAVDDGRRAAESIHAYLMS